MDTERLREFIIIVNNGSIKKAAEELGIAPNVLSTRFKSFENSLGLSLLKRNARGQELTPGGRVLYQNADNLLREYDSIFTGMTNVRNNIFRSLKLQLCSQSMPVELGPYLDLFCRKYPQLFLGLYDENTCLIRDGLRSGAVDITFAIGREHDFEDIPGRIPICTFPKLKVHVASDHPLAAKHSIWFRELSGETFILYPRMLESCTRDLQKFFLDQSGIEYSIYDESSSPFFYDLLVPVGKGISLWGWNARSAPNTALLTIKDKGYDSHMFLLYDPDNDNETVPLFINEFLEFRRERR